MSNLVDDLRTQRGQANSDLYERYLSQETCEMFNSPGRYPDGDGLFLVVRENGEKIWEYHFVSAFIGMQHELEIGSFSEMSLSQARDRLVEMRAMAQDAFGDTPDSI